VGVADLLNIVLAVVIAEMALLILSLPGRSEPWPD
jgi:hypothetical protein